MALERYSTDQYYCVIERIHGWLWTKTTVIRYTKDLKQRQINNEPWQDMCEESIYWFNKYHRAKCQENYKGE